MRAAYFLWGALAVAGGVSLFLLKYKVQALEDQLVASQHQVVRDRSAIRVLEAEWTYLNDPERLRRLSAEHLGFGPATASHIVDISALPMRGTAEGAVSAAHPVSPLIPRLPEIEAKAVPGQPKGFTPVLFARLRSLLFPGVAGAATPPAQRPKTVR